MSGQHSNTFPSLLLSVFLNPVLACFSHTLHAHGHTSLLALLSSQTRVYPRSLPSPPLSSTYLPSSQKRFDSPKGFTFQACAHILRHSFPPICWTFHLVETHETSCLGSLPLTFTPKKSAESSVHFGSIKKLVLRSVNESEATAPEKMNLEARMKGKKAKKQNDLLLPCPSSLSGLHHSMLLPAFRVDLPH